MTIGELTRQFAGFDLDTPVYVRINHEEYKIETCKYWINVEYDGVISIIPEPPKENKDE